MSTAILSPDGIYRYWLDRDMRHPYPRTCTFIMLNPSTADATKDDPTIRRCIGYADAWGFGKLVVVNLFAYRATVPTELMQVADPVGQENDHYIVEACEKSDLIVAAWGNLGNFKYRASAVKAMVQSRGRTLTVLGITGSGQPKHPLYLKKDLTPLPWV